MAIIVGSVVQPDDSTTVQDIINCASQEVRGVLNPNFGATQAVDLQILTSYTQSISLDLLRHSRWTFLDSAPVSFFTTGTAPNSPQPWNNSYWLGPIGQAPLGTIDTGLNLTDLDIIKRDTVIDYTTMKRLAITELQPVLREFTRPGKPRVWQNLSSSPQVLTIWPPPDNYTGSQPDDSTTTGYKISFRYYKVRVDLTNVNQVIQIPDRYEDIFCYGVTAYAMRYLKEQEGYQMYLDMYEKGKVQIIKDMNLFPRAEEFVRPDPTSVTRQTTTGIGLDSGLETSIP